MPAIYDINRVVRHEIVTSKQPSLSKMTDMQGVRLYFKDGQAPLEVDVLETRVGLLLEKSELSLYHHVCQQAMMAENVPEAQLDTIYYAAYADAANMELIPFVISDFETTEADFHTSGKRVANTKQLTGDGWPILSWEAQNFYDRMLTQIAFAKNDAPHMIRLSAVFDDITAAKVYLCNELRYAQHKLQASIDRFSVQHQQITQMAAPRNPE